MEPKLALFDFTPEISTPPSPSQGGYLTAMNRTGGLRGSTRLRES